MELSGKRVIVVGLGVSGVAAARLCRARGANVIATDSARQETLSAAALGLDAELVVGGHASVDFGAAELIVLSPGVPAIEAVQLAERAGVEVVGEVELASRFLHAPLVAVGGTNGKSTVTTLVARMLEAAHPRVFVGGNLGTPLSEAVGQPWDAIVVEVSSFQLEHVRQFRPRAAALLNLSDDHLDRYPDARAYFDAKGNAFLQQRDDDVAVVPFGDAPCAAQARRGHGRVVTFGADGDYYVIGRRVTDRATSTPFDLDGVDLHGRHNLWNAAAAIACARAAGAGDDAIRRGLGAFRALPHRMALAGEVQGVRFYDDSKGTNVGAAVTALEGITEPFAVLVAGGRDKLGDYAPLVDALTRKGRAAVLIGEAASRIESALAGCVPVVRADTLTDAVARAFRLAQAGDAVLLSPACSSFDMFRSYADRGDQFVSAVAALRAREEGRA